MRKTRSAGKPENRRSDRFGRLYYFSCAAGPGLFAGWTAVCRPFHSCVLCRSFRKRPRAGCFARYNLLISPRTDTKNMDEQRNYTGSAFWITLIVVVMTVGMSLIPGFQVGRASVKRVNILSDLIRQEEHPRLEEADLYFDTTFLAEGRAIEAAAAADSLAADSAGRRASRRTGNTGVGMGSAGIPADARARSLRERGNGNRFGGARCDRGFRRRGSGHGAFLPYDARKGPPAAPSGSPFSATRSSRAIS